MRAEIRLSFMRNMNPKSLLAIQVVKAIAEVELKRIRPRQSSLKLLHKVRLQTLEHMTAFGPQV